MKPDKAFARFRFSSTWPPLYNQELISVEKEREVITITIDVLGRFVFACDNEDGHKSFVFQPMYPEIEGRVSSYTVEADKSINFEVSVGLNFEWGIDRVSLLCDGRSVLLEKDAGNEVFIVKPRIRIALGIRHTLQEIDPEKHGHGEDYLFMEIAKDLESRLIRGNKYDYIKASALLRQLLIDGDKSVALLVAKKHGVKLIFNTTIGGENRLLSLDEFLSCQSFNTGTDETIDKPLTNRQLILTYANVLGGVHMGKPLPKNPEQFALLKTDQLVAVNGKQASIESIRVLSIIVLDAVYTIVNAIITANKTTQ